MHEFEALLFSDAAIPAQELGINESKVAAVIAERGSPEAINDNPRTAPSKRLDVWSDNGTFLTTTMGIDIAGQIGIEKMRNKCPLFDEWLRMFETIQKSMQ